MNYLRQIKWLALAIALCLSQISLSASAKVVTLTTPQQTESPGKIEVIEFFSYGCPHCRDFNPLVKKWAAKLPATVSFKRVPVGYGRAAWVNLGKLYYALEATGDLARLDDSIFTAIHSSNVALYAPEKAFAWATGKGVNADNLSSAFNSFSVAGKMSVSDRMTNSYRVESVPAIAVDGKYMVFADGGFDKMLGEVNNLIDTISKANTGGR